MDRNHNVLLNKLRTLAERGDEHERKRALEMFNKIKSKYNLDADLILEDPNVVEFYEFKFKSNLEKRILNQVIYMVTGDLKTYKVGKKRTFCNTYCTKQQYEEIILAFEFYMSLFNEDLDVFITAFANKHRIFPTPDIDKKEKNNESKIDFAYLDKLNSFMDGMQDRTFKKCLMIENN